MRILQLCSARDIGGGERHVIDLANNLARRGHDVFAALAKSSPATEQLNALSQENIAHFSMRNSLNVSTARALARFIRDNRIEIVHAHVARDYPLAALVAARAGARLVLTRHVLFPLSEIHRLTLRRVRKVIAVSHAVAQTLRRSGVVPDEKIVVIHNGIDVDRFARTTAPVSTARPRVGTVGHLGPIKGHDDLIRAAGIVCSRRDDVEFIIVGEDKSESADYRRLLELLINESGFQDRIKLAGWTDDVPGFLSSLNVFVSAARSEPFGLAIIEAMAAEVPIVATKSEGAQEIIEPNTNGVIVPIGDSRAIADAVCRLLEDRVLSESLVNAARRTVQDRFSLRQMVEATERVYESAIAD